MPQRLRAPTGRDLYVLGTVPGLLSEAERVRRAVALARPAALALGVSPEGAGALVAHEESPADDVLDEMPDHDLIYREVLRRYGDVRLPPPDLIAAVREAGARDLEVVGVDFSEDAYAETFSKTVGTWDFLKIGRVQRRLSKRPPDAPDARAFALAWDAQMRRVKGLAAMEAAREHAMAEATHALVDRVRDNVLLVVEWPRLSGVMDRLRERGFS